MTCAVPVDLIRTSWRPERRSPGRFHETAQEGCAARGLAERRRLLSLGALAWLVTGGRRPTEPAPSIYRFRDGMHQYASPALTMVAQWIDHLGLRVLFLSAAYVVSLAWPAARALAAQHAIRLTYVMAGAIGLENGLEAQHSAGAAPMPSSVIDPTTYSFPSGHSLFSFCFYSDGRGAVAVAETCPPGIGTGRALCASRPRCWSRRSAFPASISGSITRPT